MAEIKCQHCGFTTFDDDFSNIKNTKCLNCSELVWKTEPNILFECGKCQKQISKNAQQCPHCGWQKTIPCHVCGVTIPYTCTSCPECGDPRPFKNLVLQQTADQKMSAGQEKKGHPWRRYFAKLIDITTIGFGFYFIILYVFTYFYPTVYQKNEVLISNQIFAGIMLSVVWVILDAVLLAGFGSSLGRWLFGISVRSTDGEYLEFDKSFKRSLLVAIQGFGMSIPFIALFTQIFAYRRLTKTGSTLWDNSAGSVVLHKDLSGIRMLFCVLAVVASFVLIGVLQKIGEKL